MLRTGQIAAPPIEVADGAWFESRTVTKPVGPKTPTHRPPWNANGLPTGATQGDAGWQAQNAWLLNGLSNPRHPFPVARKHVPVQMRNAKKQRAAEATSADASGIVAWQAHFRTVAAQRLRLLLSYRPNALLKARFAAV